MNPRRLKPLEPKSSPFDRSGISPQKQEHNNPFKYSPFDYFMGIIYLDDLLTTEEKRQMTRQIKAQIQYPQEPCEPIKQFMEDQEYFRLETPLEIERRSDDYIGKVIASIK